jgi:hypothetical protein
MVSLRTDSKRLKKAASIGAVLFITLNFFAFGVVSTYLGGDALYGHVRAGHYFVCAHGKCYEVSRSVWLYSYWHAVTALTSMALLVLTAFLCKFVSFLRKKSGHRLYGGA